MRVAERARERWWCSRERRAGERTERSWDNCHGMVFFVSWLLICEEEEGEEGGERQTIGNDPSYN